MSGTTPENYEIEDFVADESFINYHFKRNSEDQAFWDNWVREHPKNIDLVEKAKEMLQNFSLALSENEYKEELGKIKTAINYPHLTSDTNRPFIKSFLDWGKVHKPVKKRRKYALYLLPAFLLCLIGGMYILKSEILKSEQLTGKYNESEKPVVFSLGDGTFVTLGPQSSLRYPSNFGNKERKVYLEGEAQFQVFRDEAHPFKVYAGDIIGTVLGTIFNVKKLPGDSVVLVELIKGKLKVESVNRKGLSEQTVILKPDERVVFKGHGQKLFKEIWRPQADSNFLNNHLAFRKNDFEEIAQKLNEVFGLKLINQSNKKAWRFTGEFKNATANNILESICIVEGLKYSYRGDTVFINDARK